MTPFRVDDVTTWTDDYIIGALGPYLDTTEAAFDARKLMVGTMITNVQKINNGRKNLRFAVDNILDKNFDLEEDNAKLRAEIEEMGTWKFAAMAMGTLLVLLVLLGVSYALSSSLRTYVHAVPRYVYSRMQ